MCVYNENTHTRDTHILTDIYSDVERYVHKYRYKLTNIDTRGRERERERRIMLGIHRMPAAHSYVKYHQHYFTINKISPIHSNRNLHSRRDFPDSLYSMMQTPDQSITGRDRLARCCTA